MINKSNSQPLISKAASSPALSKSNLPTTITRIPIGDLKLDPRNPRLHSERQLDQLAKSIESFGFLWPVMIDGKRRVLAGHGRIAAAQRLGFQDVSTISVHHLSESQRRAFMISDNRIAEQASWDKKLLAEQLKELLAVDLDFDVEATGFDLGEIDVLIEGVSPKFKGNSDPADKLPEPNPVKVTRAGDLWLAGPHRIYCGNSLDSDSYSLLMESRRATMLVTDPPCNIKIGVNTARSQMSSDEMTEPEFAGFLAQVMQRCALYSVDGSLQYAFTDWRRMSELITAGKQSHSELINVCVWVTNNGGKGDAPYRSQHELIFVFTSGTNRDRNDLQIDLHGRCRTNVWHYSRVDSFRRSAEEPNPLGLHPPVRPVALIADAIMDCTSRRDVVLDPFLGSGTTVIAAERTGRMCYGIELDPQCVDSIIRRWQAFTGQSARLEHSGRTFAEMDQEAWNEHKA